MDLIEAATAASMNAHAPYSGFRVGAAVRGASGAVHAGCNVENVAYPEGICAEAGAIAAMVLAGERRLVEVAVIADAPAPVPPCGGCRQKLAEFGGPEVRVVMLTTGGARAECTLGDLLPLAFGAAHMGGS